MRVDRCSLWLCKGARPPMRRSRRVRRGWAPVGRRAPSFAWAVPSPRGRWRGQSSHLHPLRTCQLVPPTDRCSSLPFVTKKVTRKMKSNRNLDTGDFFTPTHTKLATDSHHHPPSIPRHATRFPNVFFATRCRESACFHPKTWGAPSLLLFLHRRKPWSLIRDRGGSGCSSRGRIPVLSKLARSRARPPAAPGRQHSASSVPLRDEPLR